MTDIFLSYTESDRDAARRVTALLESVGWTVWWDRRIPAGETWRSVLEKALENMRCMVVLWSARSIESEWVYEEASEGRRLGKLVPVLIEAVRPPAGFREIQAADLTDWDGSREHEGMRMLLADLENLLGKPGAAAQSHPAKPVDHGQIPYDPTDLAAGRADAGWWPRHRLAILAAVGVLLLAAGTVFVGLSTREPAVLARPVPEPDRRESRTSPLPAEAMPRPQPPAAAADTRAPVDAVPAQVAAEAATPPVAKLPPRARPAVGQAETTRATSARCADLLSRIQLGEALSYEAQAIFRKECQQ
jgi:hypothetical protein